MSGKRHTAPVSRRKSFDTLQKEWEVAEVWKEALYEATRTNRPKSIDNTTYDNSGSPYGIADVFHGKKNRGRCYNEPSFQIKTTL